MLCSVHLRSSQLLYALLVEEFIHPPSILLNSSIHPLSNVWRVHPLNSSYGWCMVLSTNTVELLHVAKLSSEQFSDKKMSFKLIYCHGNCVWTMFGNFKGTVYAILCVCF